MIPKHRRLTPALECRLDLELSIQGWVGERIRLNESNWLIPAPVANPGMLEMFAHRDNLQFVNGRVDAGDPVPWAGEFAGKYLLSAVQSLRLTGNAELEEVTSAFVAELISTQGSDGSLGLPLA
ncbi:hypothetical protein LJR267_009404 [Paraburkholderia hospita]|jgi:hypothetical protein|uniref:hypothetical protein n=1 Tax=Paraburkholderia hospita TaxID=169430 RepID=UPI003ECF953B